MAYINILLVEDDPDDQLFFLDAINELDLKCNCAVVNDGQEALVHLEAHKPDIIFTDVNMPLVDGVELLKSIQHLIKNIPVVVMSTSLKDREKCMELGACFFFQKPASFAELNAQIKNMLQLFAGVSCAESRE